MVILSKILAKVFIIFPCSLFFYFSNRKVLCTFSVSFIVFPKTGEIASIWVYHSAVAIHFMVLKLSFFNLVMQIPFTFIIDCSANSIHFSISYLTLNKAVIKLFFSINRDCVLVLRIFLAYPRQKASSFLFWRSEVIVRVDKIILVNFIQVQFSNFSPGLELLRESIKMGFRSIRLWI